MQIESNAEVINVLGGLKKKSLRRCQILRSKESLYRV